MEGYIGTKTILAWRCLWQSEAAINRRIIRCHRAKSIYEKHGSYGHSLPVNGKDVDGVALVHEVDSVFHIDAIRFMIFYPDQNYGLFSNEVNCDENVIFIRSESQTTGAGGWRGGA